MRTLVGTVPFEGGPYTMLKNNAAPIRLYSDRWIEDDIAAKFTGSRKRERLSRKLFRLWRKAAKGNG